MRTRCRESLTVSVSHSVTALVWCPTVTGCLEWCAMLLGSSHWASDMSATHINLQMTIVTSLSWEWAYAFGRNIMYSFIHKTVMGQKPLLGFGVTEVTAYNPVGETGIKWKTCHQINNSGYKGKYHHWYDRTKVHRGLMEDRSGKGTLEMRPESWVELGVFQEE